MRRHGEPPSLRVPKHDVTRPVLFVIDTQPVGNNLQIFNPPVAWITPHFGDELRRVRHNIWYHMRYHQVSEHPDLPWPIAISLQTNGVARFEIVAPTRI